MKQRAWRLLVGWLLVGGGGAAAAAVMGGCVQHYRADGFTGPPPADVATLAIDPGVRLVSLDGKEVQGVPAEVRNGELSEGRTIRLLPGAHGVVAGMAPYYCRPTRGDSLSGFYTTVVYDPGSDANDVLSFTAEPRGEYLLKLDVATAASRQNWRAIVIDRHGRTFNSVVSKTTGRVAHDVAGAGKH
jgi:hypothetical protein